MKVQYEKEYLDFLAVSYKKRSSEALSKKLEEYHKLEKLGQELENIPGFRGMGFFLVDRQIVTAILGAFLTYLIILMQWPSVDEEAVPDHVNNIEDYVNTLCCAALKDYSTDFDLIQNENKTMVRKYF